ncbi:hypothetical protein BRAO375_1400002 [Bradyrhizobium sp. ORS 375]|nr:hypothetical protein BRAO375_1400002 [Bradyrhizobium sp. ORS 375]
MDARVKPAHDDLRLFGAYDGLAPMWFDF